MSDPTIINNPGGGHGSGAIAIVAVIAVLAVVLFFLFRGGAFDGAGGGDVDVTIETPDVSAPAAPAAPPANGG